VYMAHRASKKRTEGVAKVAPLVHYALSETSSSSRRRQWDSK
jgi:hypothetical protein